MIDNLANFVTHLNRVRREQGQEAHDKLFRQICVDFIKQGGNSRLFAKGLLRDHPTLSFEQLEKEVK